MADKLDSRIVELERLIAELERRVAECTAQLVTARSALEQEVAKRLLAEEELTWANQLLHDQAMRDTLTGLYNRRYLEASFEHDGQHVGSVTLSIGIAIFPDHGADGQALLQAADEALYRAKQTGRNRVEMCSPKIPT